jgi:DNA helicase II / ATP-dependent DNA helicase PcrA
MYEPNLTDEQRAVIEEEEALLAAVRAALSEAAAASAPAARGELRSIDALRELRDEAISASPEDLPAVLLEMSVRQRLIAQKPPPPLPDAASPYLAHLRVREGGVRRDYLLGQGTFLDPRSSVRVVDWRVAPVAGLFYRYREGDDYEEELPGRLAEGVVEARRLIVIEAGELVGIVGDGLALWRRGGTWGASDRGALSMAEGGAGAAARAGALGVGVGSAGRVRGPDISALLDSEQYDAVCAPPSLPLVVLGTAGSGKTTVALHRLARLAALGLDAMPLSAMRVVVPEEGLARLSRRLLAPLGAGEAQVQTLDAWASALAARVFGGGITICADPPALVTSLKRHPALFRALGERFGGRAAGRSGRGERPERSPRAALRRLRRRLAELLTDRPFLSSVVEASRGDLPRTCVEESVRHTMLQLAEPLSRELSSITDASRKRALDGRPIAEATPDELAGTVDIEDLPILLYLRALQGDAAALGGAGIAHLVLDEAEDFSLFELSVLGRLVAGTRSVTLAGDEAQQTASSFAGWPASLSTLGVERPSVVRLATSYRCPRPVAELARRVLGSLAPEAPSRAARDGAPVGRFRFASDAQAQLFVAGALRDLAGREPRASVAVLAHDADAAARMHALLADLPEARLVLRGDFSFDPGIDVTDVENAKGLEFDYVVVPDANALAYPATDDARRRLHVAVTRAAHQLWIVSSGAASPLLDDP